MNNNDLTPAIEAMCEAHAAPLRAIAADVLAAVHASQCADAADASQSNGLAGGCNPIPKSREAA